MTGDDVYDSGEIRSASIINFLPRIFWERRFYILAPFLLSTAGGIGAAYFLPTVFQSTATLLVQSQDLPKALVDSPTAGAVDQRVARIRQEALSRDNLISIMQQNDLYAKERQSKPLSEIIEKMRKATVIGALTSDIGQQSGSQGNTIAISMSFDYPDPSKAQAVLQNLVSKFLTTDNQNIEDEATLSVRFLQDQATKLQTQILQVEHDLTALKTKNGAALASSGMPPLIDTGSFSAQIAALQSDNRQLLVQTRRPTEANPALAAAETALIAAQAQYSDTHPDVVQARERLNALRRTFRAEPDPAAGPQQLIAANNQSIQTLIAQRDAMLARANSTIAGQTRAPAVMEQASQLENQATTLRSQYQQISDSLLKAQNSARMTTEQRAERLTLVEPASLPDHPLSPNRSLIIALAALAGLGLGLLIALVFEFVRKPIRSARQLEVLGYPVLGVIPLIRKPQPSRRFLTFPWQRKSYAG